MEDSNGAAAVGGVEALPASAAQLAAELRGVSARAEVAAAAAMAAGADAGAELPDAWQAAFRAALQVARSGAVDELLGNFSSCLRSYVIVRALLCSPNDVEQHTHMQLLPAGCVMVHAQLCVLDCTREGCVELPVGLLSSFALNRTCPRCEASRSAIAGVACGAVLLTLSA